MTNVEGTPRTYFEAEFVPASERALAVAGQLLLFMALLMCSRASAQNEHGLDYIRSSQPPLLTYQELVALNEGKTIDPPLADKLHTLLTTPFINNEAYFAGTKPLRSDIKDMGLSLRLVESVGKFRLDWIFVKGYLKEDPTTPDSYRFAPAFARTMKTNRTKH
jgi:hypothetical protein